MQAVTYKIGTTTAKKFWKRHILSPKGFEKEEVASEDGLSSASNRNHINGEDSPPVRIHQGGSSLSRNTGVAHYFDAVPAPSPDSAPVPTPFLWLI
jgi:hypothetical protein